MHKYLLTLPFAFAISVAAAQTTDESAEKDSGSKAYKYFVRVHSGMCINQQKVIKVTKKVPVYAGSSIKSQRTIKDNKGAVYNLEKTIKVKRDSLYTISYDSMKVIPIASPKARANITQKKDTLYINYWLFANSGPYPKLEKKGTDSKPAAATVSTQEQKKTPDLCGKPVETPRGFMLRNAFADKGDTTYVHAYQDTILTITEGGVQKKQRSVFIPFDRSSTYYILLNDRQARRFYFRNWELGALTIPIQFRQGGSRAGKKYSPQTNIDLSLGGYLGFKVGQITYSYNKYETIAPRKFSLSLGPFLGVTRTELNASNTTTSATPLTGDATRHFGVMSTGLGLMTDIDNFRIGLFAGRDFGGGSDFKEWDHRNKTWFGVGIGYQLVLLKRKE